MAPANRLGSDRAAQLYELTSALGTALTRAQVAQVLVERGVAAMGAVAGSVALLDPSGTRLDIVAAIGYPPDLVAAFRQFPLAAPVPLADAVRARQPIWIDSEVAFLARYPALAVHQANQPRGGWAAIPLLAVSGVLGAVGLSFAAPLSISPEDRAFIVSLTQQCAQALERARLFEVEQQAHRQAALLARYSSALANSLDYETTLENIVRLAVPMVGQACLVYLLGDDRPLHPAAIAHAEPALDRQLQALIEHSEAVPIAPSPLIIQVATQGEPAFISNPEPSAASSFASDHQAELDRALAALDLRSCLALPMQARGYPLGVMALYHVGTVSAFSDLEVELSRQVAQVAAMALDNARLYRAAQRWAAELEARVQERTQAVDQAFLEHRRLLQRLTEVREEERARLAREIHDEVGGSLAGLKMDLARLKRLATGNQPDLPDRLDDLSNSIDGIVRTVRKVATELRPSLLDHFGLAEAVEDTLQQFQNRSDIDCHFSVQPPDLEVDRSKAVSLFRIVQEALTNVARHAQASRVWVRLERVGGYLVLEIRDDGRGISEAELAQRNTLGLAGMRERVASLSGQILIQRLPDQGTTITVEVPL